jgi:hypothetical protein
MIQILTVLFIAVMLYSLKESFLTLAVNIPPNHVLITH